MMRILLIHPAIFIGGAERIVAGLLAGLVRRGHDAKLLTLSTAGGLVEQFRVPEDRIIVPRSHTGGALLGMDYRNPRTLNGALQDVRTLRHQLRELDGTFDLVNPHNFPASDLVGLARIEAAAVWTCNEPYPLILRENLRTQSSQRAVARMLSSLIGPFDVFFVRNWIDAIVVLDEFNQRRVRDFYRRPSTVVPSPIEYEQFRRGQKERLLEKYGLDGCFILLQVGWLNPLKNQQASIRALKTIKETIPEAKLVLVGGGAALESLKDEAVRLGLKDSVVFAGRVPDESLPDYYDACDLNLFPNLSQTWGLAPVEALAAGRVSIVSNEAGVAEFLGRHNVAIVVPPNASDIAKATVSVYRGEVDIRDMISRGQQLVRTELSWDTYVDRMVACFEATLRNSRSS